MANSIIGTCPGDDEDFEELNRMTNEQLRERLHRCMLNTIESILDTARCIRVLEDRNVDLADLDTPWFRLVRRVAYGQVLPELIFKVNDRTVFERVARMPLPEQRRVANDEPLQLAIVDPETDEVDHRMVAPSRMNKAERNQVFGKGFIRSVADQARQIKNKKMPKPDASITVHLTAKQWVKAAKAADKLKITVGDLVLRAMEAQNYI